MDLERTCRGRIAQNSECYKRYEWHGVLQRKRREAGRKSQSKRDIESRFWEGKPNGARVISGSRKEMLGRGSLCSSIKCQLNGWNKEKEQRIGVRRRAWFASTHESQMGKRNKDKDVLDVRC